MHNIDYNHYSSNLVTNSRDWFYKIVEIIVSGDRFEINLTAILQPFLNPFPSYQLLLLWEIVIGMINW